MSEFIKPGLLMAAVGVTRYLDAEDPDTLFWARVAFVAGACLGWALQGLIYLRIQSRNDTAPLTVAESDLDPNAAGPLASLMGHTEAGPPVETSHKAYDLLKLSAEFKQSAISPVVTLLLHLYMGYFPPLVIGAVLAPLTVLMSPLARLHLLSLFSSAPPAKDLKRPWRAKGIMSQYKELKREVMKELNDGKEPSGSRKNKKDANRRRVGK